MLRFSAVGRPPADVACLDTLDALVSLIMLKTTFYSASAVGRPLGQDMSHVNICSLTSHTQNSPATVKQVSKALER